MCVYVVAYFYSLFEGRRVDENKSSFDCTRWHSEIHTYTHVSECSKQTKQLSYDLHYGNGAYRICVYHSHTRPVVVDRNALMQFRLLCDVLQWWDNVDFVKLGRTLQMQVHFRSMQRNAKHFRHTMHLFCCNYFIAIFSFQRNTGNLSRGFDLVTMDFCSRNIKYALFV